MNLKGKTIIFLGSSVTEGGAAHNYSMCEFVQTELGCTVEKWAVSGTTLADINSGSYVSRLNRNIENQEQCDCFVCQLSTNDASNDISLGTIGDRQDSFDVKTTLGAIEYIVATVKEKWDCPVLFYTGTYMENKKYEKMVELLFELKKKWDFGIIDLWNDKEMRNVSEDDYKRFMNDPVHPTRCGYEEWWGPKFVEYLKNEI